jgi:hypothetical protein
MALERDTVAIPFSSGIRPTSRARLLDAQKLLTAQNCMFILDEGPQKRNGHVGRQVRTGATYPGLNGLSPPSAAPSRETFSFANPNLPTTWLYGWGIRGTENSTTSDPFEVSPQPDVGQLFGSAARDSEVVVWDGHRIFSYAPSQPAKFGETQSGASATSARGPACMPAMRAYALAKTATAQNRPDAANNGVLQVVAWLNGDGITGGYSAYDSSNRAALVSNATLTYQAPKSLRCLSVGAWFHILVSDTTANSLEMRSVHQDSPDVVISRSLGNVDNTFDVKKIDETQFVVVKSKANALTMFVLNSDGSTKTSFVPALGGRIASANTPLAIEINDDLVIGTLWVSLGAPNIVNFAGFNLAGGLSYNYVSVFNPTALRRLTLSPRLVRPTSASGRKTAWDVFTEDFTGASLAQTLMFYVEGDPTTSAVTAVTNRHRLSIASHAFRVGNRSFLWCTNWTTGSIGLQTTWFLCDASLAPVGKLDYGQANADLGGSLGALPSVNWHTNSSHPYKDRIVFHGVLPYNQRVATISPSSIPNGVFTEASIRYYELDFLPKLRSGQAGRATYFAGSQLWSYDGAEMVEAGFHVAPEGITGAGVAGGGALLAGTYRYRVDLCHKNAQNEEVRSWSIITAGIVATLNGRITLTIPTVPVTRREDAYFLIFRTEANLGTYYLCNSRDPQSANFLRNTLSNFTLTYTDGLADTLLAAREYHPANAAGNYLDPLPAPACEIVAAGRDRLWLAGGELAPGEVAPSRLFFPGTAPAFSPALNIQVDRNAEPITALGFVGDIAAVFRKTSTYTIESDGPDNSLNGAWAQPRLTVADTGAVGQEGLALTVVGLWFQSPAGFRLLGNGGAMDPQAGQDVDPLVVSSTYASAVVVPQYTQVRWYSNDITKPSIVLDYSSNAWSLWTGLTSVGAVFWPVSNLAVLSSGDGRVLAETAGEYTDAGTPFEMIIRTANLRARALGDFQRVRRFALFGNSAAPLTLRTRIYYDERPFYDEELVRTYPLADGNQADGVDPTSSFNTSVWGAGDDPPFNGPVWGSFSVWGDERNQLPAQTMSGLDFRDGVFKFRWRPGRQKCSVISFEFSDMGATNAGFEPVVLALELGVKPGLDRIPTP